jgi:hypothetical protein
MVSRAGRLRACLKSAKGLVTRRETRYPDDPTSTFSLSLRERGRVRETDLPSPQPLSLAGERGSYLFPLLPSSGSQVLFRHPLRARGRSRTEPFGADSARMQGGAKRGMLEVFERATTQPRGRGRGWLGHAFRGRFGTLPGFQTRQTGQNPPEGRRGAFVHGLLGAGCYAAAWVAFTCPAAEARPADTDKKPVPAARDSSPGESHGDVRLLPLFAKPIPQLKGQMEQTVGEALSMPTTRLRDRQQVPPALTVRQREDSAVWVRRILRPEWIDEPGLGNWIALPASVQGQDALFSGWISHGHPLQIVATAERIHVRMPMPAQAKVAAGLDLIRRAAVLARPLFNTDTDWEKLPWQVRGLGDFTFGYVDTPFIRDWWESCLIVSDGNAVKFSFLRIPHRDSPPAGHLARQKPQPWFRATSGRKR